MTRQAARDARVLARSCDPIDRIRHDITRAPAEHVRPVQPTKSDLEVGVDYLIASARYRIHRIIDARCDLALHELSVIASSQRRSMGQLLKVTLWPK